MKATAKAHPIQGLVKYHGMRDSERRFPYHDSISVCTAPSHTRTTVAFEEELDDDCYIIDGSRITGRGAERIRSVVERVRELSEQSYTEHPVRLESENTFQTNIGFGSSSSGFAAAAVALADAADLTVTEQEISTIARRGSASAARAVTGGFSILHSGVSDNECVAKQLPTDDGLVDDLRIVVGKIPAYKETEDAHEEAEESHMFEARLSHVHSQLDKMKKSLRHGDLDNAFELAEHDSLSLAATTMTGPSGWVYWEPETLDVLATVRQLRDNGVPAYFSTDTGASVYVNTTATASSTVEEAIQDLGIETKVWEVGGPATIIQDSMF